MDAAPSRSMLLRRRVHFVLDSGLSERSSRVVHAALIVLIVASVAAVVLETVPEYETAYRRYFYLVELLATIGFSAEYAARLWSAPETPAYAGVSPWRARLSYSLTLFGIVDLLTIVPLGLSLFVSGETRILLLLQLVRFLKLARYSQGMRSLIAALQAERRALGASAVIILGVMLLMATAMYLAERVAQPDHFGSIPQAMWWAVITVTTVGYGDVVPVTAVGKTIAGFAAISGLLLLGLPIGVIATAFSEEIHRREFVVTWAMIARVPLFATLDASEIAEIMHHLRAQTIPANTLVVRRGDEAHCMYFVAAGEVAVETPQGPVRLGEGQFFGEVALLRETRRTATIRTTRQSKLLLLEARDLRLLMQREPEIRKRIEQAIATRGYSSLAERGEMAMDRSGDNSEES